MICPSIFIRIKNGSTSDATHSQLRVHHDHSRTQYDQDMRVRPGVAYARHSIWPWTETILKVVSFLFHVDDHARALRFRWYTKWFDKATLSGSTLCMYSLQNRVRWEEDIAKWQNPILEDASVEIAVEKNEMTLFRRRSLPDWYKSALFNETYFIADGGSIWLDVSDDLTVPEHVRKWGRFGYLEGTLSTVRE